MFHSTHHPMMENFSVSKESTKSEIKQMKLELAEEADTTTWIIFMQLYIYSTFLSLVYLT